MHITPSYFRQIPIRPADEGTQRSFVDIVERLLAVHAELGLWREHGYTIRARRDGSLLVDIPYDLLQAEVQAKHPDLGAFSLYDAMTTGQFTIPAQVDLTATISSNIFVPTRHPTSLVLRNNRLWLDVPDGDTRRYLEGYLIASRWRGKTWDDIKTEAIVWEDERGRAAFFAAEASRRREILGHVDEGRRLDTRIDEMALDLYGIMDVADRERVMGSAPQEDEDGEDTDDEQSTSQGTSIVSNANDEASTMVN